MAAFLVCSALLAQPARGEVEVEIASSVTIGMPAEVVLTASVSEDETIIAYDWASLPTVERCRTRMCRLQSELAACRRVETEVTSLRGDVGVASAQVCIPDVGGEAPRAEIVVELEGTKTRVRARADAGADDVLFARLWVDAMGPFDDGRAVELDVANDCHVVDVLVADVVGRVGFATRRFCTDEAPRAWIGLDALCPRIDSNQRLCVEIEHPLGLEVSTSSTTDLDADCNRRRAPGALERHVFIGEDERGQRVFASAFGCGSGGDGRLMFVEPPPPANAGYGERFRVEPKVFGGRAPFSATATGFDVALATSVGEVDLIAPASYDADGVVEGSVTLRDAEGRTATFDVTVRLDGDPIPVLSESASGCTSTRGSPTGVYVVLVGLLALARRRR